MEAQAVEMEPATKVDIRKALEKTLFSDLMGEWYSFFLKRGIKKAAWIMRKKRASGGNERIQKVRNVRVQDGSDGCNRAQLSDLMSGCAGLVRGATLAREGGSASCLSGNSIGETWGGQFSLAIWARLSTTSRVFGHLTPAGRSFGRSCRYDDVFFKMKLP